MLPVLITTSDRLYNLQEAANECRATYERERSIKEQQDCPAYVDTVPNQPLWGVEFADGTQLTKGHTLAPYGTYQLPLNAHPIIASVESGRDTIVIGNSNTERLIDIIREEAKQASIHFVPEHTEYIGKLLADKQQGMNGSYSQNMKEGFQKAEDLGASNVYHLLGDLQEVTRDTIRKMRAYEPRGFVLGKGLVNTPENCNIAGVPRSFVELPGGLDNYFGQFKEPQAFFWSTKLFSLPGATWAWNATYDGRKMLQERKLKAMIGFGMAGAQVALGLLQAQKHTIHELSDDRDSVQDLERHAAKAAGRTPSALQKRVGKAFQSKASLRDTVWEHYNDVFESYARALNLEIGDSAPHLLTAK